MRNAISHLLLSVGSALLLNVSASAVPTVDIHFDDDALGGPPSTNFQPSPGEPIIKPGSISDPGGQVGLFTISNDYRSGAATLEGRSVVMHVDNEPDGSKVVGGQLNIKGHPSDFEPGTDYVLKLKLLFNGEFGAKHAGALMINFYNSTFAGAGYQAQVVFANGSINILPGGLPAERVELMNVWDYDEVLEVEVRVRYSTNSLEVLINQQEVGTASLGSAREPQGVGGIQLVNASESSHFEVGIANIRAESFSGAP